MKDPKLVCQILVLYVSGLLTGICLSNVVWQNRLVDNPDGIAAIRSEVLAERAK